MPAGVRLAFRSNTTSVAGQFVPQTELAPIDLCIDGQLRQSVPLAGKDSFQFDGLSNRDKLVELWLPQFGPFQLRSLTLSASATLAPFEDARPRWITYGSSITHCRTAESPTQTWPAIVARERNLNLTCLGYGGQCHLDPLVATMIRDLPADFISLCVGINVLGGATMNERTFRPGIIAFVRIIREKHPTTPIAVISPIYSESRESTPNIVGLDLRSMRKEVAAAVEALENHGDHNIRYIDGLQLFGPELADLCPDGLHPSAEGYKVMGQRFLKVVAPKLFGRGG